jgi:manganese/zinc/iron transport system permease protein
MDALDFLQLSLTPIIIAVLASVACALPGNFLLLRRQSLIGDAVSHVVLPGVVGAYVLTGAVSTLPMLIGAAVAAIIAVILIELIRRLGKIESGAAMGVVFTALFAAGVLWLELSHASSVHLDVEHVLYGNLESLIWLDAEGWQSLVDPVALAQLPDQLIRLVYILIAILVFLVVAWRALVVGTFDPDFAAGIGARPGLFNFLLLIVVALAAVAAFEAVGAVIVVAMFICPPATARLMTNSLRVQMQLSILFASTAAIAGYVLASWGPFWLGWPHSVSAAGMIAFMGGFQLAIGFVFGRHRLRTAS